MPLDTTVEFGGNYSWNEVGSTLRYSNNTNVWLTPTYEEIDIFKDPYHIADLITNWGKSRVEIVEENVTNEGRTLTLKRVVENETQKIKKVIFNDPATIVLWEDGTKTVVKIQKGDRYDPEKGLAMACMKKILSKKDYHRLLEVTKKAMDDAKNAFEYNLTP